MIKKGVEARLSNSRKTDFLKRSENSIKRINISTIPNNSSIQKRPKPNLSISIPPEYPSASNTNKMEVNSKDTERKKKEAQKHNRTFSPKGHTGPWTRAEHLLVIKAVEQYGNEWKKVKRYVGTRSRTQIRSHIQKHYIRQRENTIKGLIKSEQINNQIFLITKEYRNMQSFPTHYFKRNTVFAYEPKKQDYSYMNSFHSQNPPVSEYPQFEPNQYEDSEFYPFHEDIFQEEFQIRINEKRQNEIDFETLQCRKEENPIGVLDEPILDLLLPFETEGLSFLQIQI